MANGSTKTVHLFFFVRNIPLFFRLLIKSTTWREKKEHSNCVTLSNRWNGDVSQRKYKSYKWNYNHSSSNMTQKKQNPLVYFFFSFFLSISHGFFPCFLFLPLFRLFTSAKSLNKLSRVCVFMLSFIVGHREVNIPQFSQHIFYEVYSQYYIFCVFFFPFCLQFSSFSAWFVYVSGRVVIFFLFEIYPHFYWHAW